MIPPQQTPQRTPGRSRSKPEREVPWLMLVTEPSPRLAEIVSAAVAGSVNIVQLRDKSAPPEQLRATAERLRQVTQGRAQLFINSAPELAQAVGAEGVHLPEGGSSLEQARSLLGAGKWIGRSVHSVAAARQAEDEGADYLIAGTIFASPSHPDLAPAGLDYLREVCQTVEIPVLAIGGITPENVGACLQAGAAGVAVLSTLLHANDPQAVACAYRHHLSAAWQEVRTPRESRG